jgi:hypothetical protein
MAMKSGTPVVVTRRQIDGFQRDGFIAIAELLAAGRHCRSSRPDGAPRKA